MSEIESTLEYTGRVFTVTRDRVRLPHGVETTLDVVRHRGSVVLIPMPDPASVILVRQYRHAIGQHVWELPAGSLEPGEEADVAALRECHEEIGQLATTAERVASLYPVAGIHDRGDAFLQADGAARTRPRRRAGRGRAPRAAHVRPATNCARSWPPARSRT